MLKEKLQTQKSRNRVFVSILIVFFVIGMALILSSKYGFRFSNFACAFTTHTKYYFAYGSNMNHKQMRRRCPNSRYLSRALLRDYKFVFDGYSRSRKGSVANVIKSRGDIVWGGIFEIDRECLSSLDRYEGYPKSYDRRVIQVRDDEGKEFKVVIYLRGAKAIGQPSKAYREVILEGARDCNLPQEYVNTFIVVE